MPDIWPAAHGGTTLADIFQVHVEAVQAPPIRRVTETVAPKLGIAAECFPSPPATRTRISSTLGTAGMSASDAMLLSSGGQSRMPYIPPSASSSRFRLI